jgi:hypothetical protein
MFSRNGEHWFPDILWLSFSSVVDLDDKRFWVIQNKFLYPARNPLHGLFC